MKRYALIILILLTIMFLSTAGKETQKTTPELPKLSTSVRLQILGDRELKDDVRRYISTELKSLGDVKVVRDKPEWALDIHARRIYTPWTKDTLARPVGFSLSIVILTPLRIDRKILKSLSEGRINDKDCEMLVRLIGQTYWYPSHMAWSGKDLQYLCQEAIKYFDTKLLRPDEKHLQELRRKKEQQRQEMVQEREKVRALREKIRKERSNQEQ
ncbi:MAG: hypothetical protein ACYSWZ_04910 [Planctomycetota bacterium]|jgi:hypothetical protein